MTDHEHGDACESCIPAAGLEWLARKVAAPETLEAVLTRSIAHTYGLDGDAAQVIARERLAAFEAMAVGHVPVFANLQRLVDAIRPAIDAYSRAVLELGKVLVDITRRLPPHVRAQLAADARPSPPSWTAFVDRPERQRRRR